MRQRVLMRFPARSSRCDRTPKAISRAEFLPERNSLALGYRQLIRNGCNGLAQLPIGAHEHRRRDSAVVPSAFSKNRFEISVHERWRDERLPWRRPLNGAERLIADIPQARISCADVFIQPFVKNPLVIKPPAPHTEREAQKADNRLPVRLEVFRDDGEAAVRTLPKLDDQVVEFSRRQLVIGQP